MNFVKRLSHLAVSTVMLVAMLCAAPAAADKAVQHILFIGDSFTHGRYLPVRHYNNGGEPGSNLPSRQVVDENFGQPEPPRKELPSEEGPDGGIPGIFSELAYEAGIPYDVHIEADSATNLHDNYEAAKTVINQPTWTAVVLQDISLEPVPPAVAGSAGATQSNPALFCSSVAEIEHGVHDAAPGANIYLYETWAPADTAFELSGSQAGVAAEPSFLKQLALLTGALHDSYLDAAHDDGHIAGIAPVGDAWARAWGEKVADPDPYKEPQTGVSLDFGYQAGSEPATNPDPAQNAAGFHHPSIYGAYLSGLVLFERITGVDVRRFGASEQAAGALGIAAPIALRLQTVAWEAVTYQNARLLNPSVDLCSVGK